MASHRIVSSAWAGGTTVSVYKGAALPAGVDVPSGTPVASGIVDSAQSVTFTDLQPGIAYVAIAGGVTKRFLVPLSDDPVEPLRTRVEDAEAYLGATNLAKGRNRLIDGDDFDNTDRLQSWLETEDVEAMYLPEGVYRYESVLHTRTKPLRVYGPGTLRSTLPLTTNTAEFWLKGSDVELNGLGFDQVVSFDIGTQAQLRAPNAHTVRLGGVSSGAMATNVRAINLRIPQSRNTPVLVQYVNRFSLRKCDFANAMGNGFFIGDSGYGLWVIDNDIYNCGDDLIGVYQNTGMGDYIYGVLVAFNRIGLGDAKGIGVGGVKRGRVCFNEVDFTWTPGIMSTEDSFFNLMGNYGLLIDNNQVSRAGKNFGPGRHSIPGFDHSVPSTVADGLSATGNHTGVRFKTNQVYDTQRRGFSVDRGVDMEVSDNDIDGAGSIAGSMGDPDDTANYTRLVNPTMNDNRFKNTVGGITLGSCDNGSAYRNKGRAFGGAGAVGSQRGLTIANVRNTGWDHNQLNNDDSADANIFVYGTNVNLNPGPNNIEITAGVHENRSSKIQSVAYAASITPVLANGPTVKVGTLTGNITVNAPAEPIRGAELKFIFTQDATGGRTITFSSAFRKNWTPDTSANALNSISFQYDGTSGRWTQTGAATGLT